MKTKTKEEEREREEVKRKKKMSVITCVAVTLWHQNTSCAYCDLYLQLAHSSSSSRNSRGNSWDSFVRGREGSRVRVNDIDIDMDMDMDMDKYKYIIHTLFSCNSVGTFGTPLDAMLDTALTDKEIEYNNYTIIMRCYISFSRFE
jgi:hypothetical protein